MHSIFLRFAALLLAALATLAHATEPVSTSWMNGAAIGGKDAVSYYSAEAKASHQVVEGSSTFTVEYLGVPWRFASKASADKFAANPAAYAPQYNGHCSNGLSLGEGLISTSGSVWELFDNKLHLFYAERGRQRWLTGDWKAYRQQADKAWQDLLTAKR
jgi:YHS domain-containing protein